MLLGHSCFVIVVQNKWVIHDCHPGLYDCLTIFETLCLSLLSPNRGLFTGSFIRCSEQPWKNKPISVVATNEQHTQACKVIMILKIKLRFYFSTVWWKCRMTTGYGWTWEASGSGPRGVHYIVLCVPVSHGFKRQIMDTIPMPTSSTSTTAVLFSIIFWTFIALEHYIFHTKLVFQKF